MEKVSMGLTTLLQMYGDPDWEMEHPELLQAQHDYVVPAVYKLMEFEEVLGDAMVWGDACDIVQAPPPFLPAHGSACCSPAGAGTECVLAREGGCGGHSATKFLS